MTAYSNSSTSGCTVHYKPHCKCMQKTMAHVTTHNQAACWATGCENEIVMTCSLYGGCCTIDTCSRPNKVCTVGCVLARLLQKLYAGQGSRQEQTRDLPFHMRPRGCKEALSLVKGTRQLHRNLDISTLHQAGNGDSQHVKSSCIV